MSSLKSLGRDDGSLDPKCSQGLSQPTSSRVKPARHERECKTSPAQSEDPAKESKSNGGSWPTQEIVPRILSLKAAEKYSGLSQWTLRDLILAGHIARLNIPDTLHPGRNLARIFTTPEAIDMFIRMHTTGSSGGNEQNQKENRYESDMH